MVTWPGALQRNRPAGRSSYGARAEAIAVEDLGVVWFVGGSQVKDVSATMRCRVRWPIRLMAGLLST